MMKNKLFWIISSVVVVLSAVAIFFGTYLFIIDDRADDETYLCGFTWTAYLEEFGDTVCVVFGADGKYEIYTDNGTVIDGLENGGRYSFDADDRIIKLRGSESHAVEVLFFDFQYLVLNFGNETLGTIALRNANLRDVSYIPEGAWEYLENMAFCAKVKEIMPTEARVSPALYRVDEAENYENLEFEIDISEFCTYGLLTVTGAEGAETVEYEKISEQSDAAQLMEGEEVYIGFDENGLIDTVTKCEYPDEGENE